MIRAQIAVVSALFAALCLTLGSGTTKGDDAIDGDKTLAVEESNPLSHARNALEAEPPYDLVKDLERLRKLRDVLEAESEKRRAHQATIGELLADPRSDDEKRHVALDHPDSEVLISGLKEEVARLSGVVESIRDRLNREILARVKTENKLPENAPWVATSESEKFELWTGCKPLILTLNVHDTTDDGFGGFGLSEESIQFAVESRLRAAKLYAELLPVAGGEGYSYGPSSILDVLVQRDDHRLFRVVLKLKKPLFDLDTGLKTLSQSWQTSSYGLGPPEYIRSVLAEHMDRFISNYLRVNKKACERK